MGTFSLLNGTEHAPDLRGAILLIEDDNMVHEFFGVEFDRNLQALIQQPGFSEVRGLLIGKFQKKTGMDMKKLKYIIGTKKELSDVPIIANVNFGHTNPMLTLPIGGVISISAGDKAFVRVVEH